ncbi:MAG: DNA helicase UvrD [Deltaproteobacteria bacterium]|nr:DNA helicase UvrD [Deltaproteobacteria bacterium]
MSSVGRPPAPDQSERDAAIAERARNVVLDAGAGTGKTTILVERVVRMVAPPDDVTDPPIPIRRIAAVTFTRRAAGELRLRIRERLLGELARTDTSASRQQLLRDALGGLDTAHVGTIHSFADRLLRLRPVEARLSPSYDIVEDNADLVRETLEVLLHSAQTGSLAGELSGSTAAALANEAERTIIDAVRAGFLTHSREVTDYFTEVGLDALVSDFINHRDVEPILPDLRQFDPDAFAGSVREFVALVQPLSDGSGGTRWLRGTASLLAGLVSDADPIAVIGSTRRRLNGPYDARKKTGFGGSEEAWRVWKLFSEGKYKKDEREQPLRDAIRDPLRSWFAPRLVRLFPVVNELYRKVKERHRQLDQIDLLLVLRTLLRDDLGCRAFYRSLFDHVLVDEFQDTDPLQAEIVVFLCEDGRQAASWRDARLRPGTLTIVGDPKQSIYRFRRADIATYDEVRSLVARQDHLAARLSANFRSAEPLIRYFNDRFARLLGTPPSPSQTFDPQTGTVFHQDLEAGRTGVGEGSTVEILRYEFPAGETKNTDAHRDLEGEMLARYLRHLVENSGRIVEDAITGQRRLLRYGDVAVLTLATSTLHHLFKSFDELSIPYSARGGRLFLEDDLQRRFILGLRALADRDDGIAVATLLRPPFFAVDPLDLALEIVHQRPSGDRPLEMNAEAARAREARDFVRELSRKRFRRPPGETARALLEQTLLARTVALEANGEQRLRYLRELCFVLESVAAAEGLDFDGATERLRAWVDAPVQLDPPHPVAADAIHVMTVHQAKGLEFPVVVLWDSCAQLASRGEVIAWRTTADGRNWSMALDDFAWEEPRGVGLQAIEKGYRDAERKRLVYVAATRARDLLLLPRAAMAGAQHVSVALTDGVPPELAASLGTYTAGAGAEWSTIAERSSPATLGFALDDAGASARWRSVADSAARPRCQPVAVTGLPNNDTDAAQSVGILADIPLTERDESLPPSSKRREGRFGPNFGQTVHLAIARSIRDPRVSIETAVRDAARTTGLLELLREAEADVARAVGALRAESLLADGVSWRVEYPIVGLRDGRLVSGYIDFLAIVGSTAYVLDFKTDSPPQGMDQPPQQYRRQLAGYADLLGDLTSAEGWALRAGLVYTATGSIHWVGGTSSGPDDDRDTVSHA